MEKSIDLLLINPSLIDHNPRNLFSLIFHKLVNYCPPGLLYLAANTRKNGYKVKIYDMELNDNINDLIKYIREVNPKIIGITALTFTYINALKVLKVIKKEFPKVLTLIGGLHICRNPKDAIRRNLADFELLGEADNTIIQLLDYLIKKEGSLENIPGLVYKRENIIEINENFPIIEDLNSLPYPAIDLIERDRYFISFQKYHPSTIIMGSRGCPFNCIFCDKLSNRVRLRSTDNIVSEIKSTYKKYNIRDFQFYDLTFNVNMNWVKELCLKLKKENLPIVWRCTAKVELIDEELIKLMKEAGCYLIAFGVESGNDDSLDFLKKGFSVKDIIHAFKLAKKYSIETHAYYIIGIPGEDKAKVLNTIRLLKSISPDYVNSLTLRPLPHTELAKLSMEKGWFDFSKYDIFNPDFKYQSNITLNYNEMTSHQIIKMKKISMRAYFLNIKYLIHLLKKFLKEPNRFLFNIWRSIKELIKIF
ncbi:MAG: B12-binding domain-containing radical SAM protein [Promethearchaeota archaeon]